MDEETPVADRHGSRDGDVRMVERVGRTGGFTVAELLVTLSVIAALATLTVPSMLTALNAFTTSRGAKDIQGALSQARMLAITTRQNICVQPTAGGYQFLQGGCTGPAWLGANTDGSGVFHPANSVVVAGPSPIFTPFGTATQTGSLSVSSYSGAGGTTVTVWPSGRVSIP